MKHIVLGIITVVFLYIMMRTAGDGSSGGLGPNGGMRDAMRDTVLIQTELKYDPVDYPEHVPFIYDLETIPSPTITEVGHWTD